MANNLRFCLVATFLVLCAASQSRVVVVGSPTPVITSAATNSQEMPPNAKQSIGAMGENSSGSAINALAADKPSDAIASKTFSVQQQQRPNNVADKLKRGLTNFVNNLNPAPYFVPNNGQFAQTYSSNNNKLQQQQQPPKSTSTREPPTIINDGPSADAVIKGPNRLVQARRLGGPLRWGR